MFPYRLDLSEIPFQIGGDLYAVGAEQGYIITRCRHAIDGIVALENGIGILAYGTLILEEDEYCLTSLEHAQKWVRENRPDLPCTYADTAGWWLKTSETLPGDSREVTVLADGQKRKAFFDEETGRFYPHGEPESQPIEHVTEWTENPDSERHISILDIQEEERRGTKPCHRQEIEI